MKPETSSVWLFATTKETIKEIKMRIGGGRKIEIFGSGGPRVQGVVNTDKIGYKDRP